MRVAFIFIIFIAASVLCSAQQKAGEVISSSYFKPVSAKNAEPVQAKNDSVNISELIEKQIAAAHQKELEKKNQPQAAVKKAVAAPKPEIKKIIKEEKTSEASMTLNYILFIVGASGIMFYFMFKNVLFTGRRSNSALKKNIKLLREEKLIVKSKEKKNNPRTKLVEETSQMASKDKDLPQIARERNISQGEILLAARIKSYEMAKVCSIK